MGKNVLGGEFFTIEGNNKTSHVSMIENRLQQKKFLFKDLIIFRTKCRDIDSNI
jgi:hypothetical protein